MMVLFYANVPCTAASFNTHYKEIKKCNHFLIDLLEYFIMDGLFKRIVYTVIERELHHNASPNLPPPKYDITMKSYLLL